MDLQKTLEKRQHFLEALAQTCSVLRACEIAEVSRAAVYKWRDADAEFAKQWELARARGADALEDEAVRRAYEGIEEPIFHQGRCVDTVHRYSDTLLIFLLKGAKPEKYRENSRLELTGKDGGPVQVNETEKAARLAAILAAGHARKLADEPGRDSGDPAVSDAEGTG